jgi:hypothetical protein
MGKNPAKIALHSVYADLGVYLSDPPTNDIADLHTFLNGIEVQQVQIDTSTTSVNTIRYAATDSKGNSAEVTRTVEVYDPYAPIVPAPTMPTTPSQGETSTSTQ